MKRLLAAVCILMALAGQARAQHVGDAGLGLIFGNNGGLTGKYWLPGGHALDGGIGLGSDVAVYGDYLWHSREVFSQPSEGTLSGYLGLGIQVGESQGHNSGLRAVMGAAYWMQSNPLEIFVEIVPLLRFSSGDATSVGAGVGIRYYFNWD